MARKKYLSFETSQKVFAIRLSKLMAERNVNQPQLAAVINVQRQTISNYANGQSIPDSETLASIASFFQVSADYLIGLRDDPTTDKDIQFIVDYTGLSSEAIETIHSLSWMRKDVYQARGLEIISNCITSFYSSFLDVLGHLRYAAEDAEEELQADKEDDIQRLDYLQMCLENLQRELFVFSQLCNKIPRKMFDAEIILEDLESETDRIERVINAENEKRVDDPASDLPF